MSKNLDLIRALYENFDTFFELGRRGEGPLELIYTEDAVIDIGSWDVPGFEREYQGIDALRRFWKEWFGSWGSLTWRAEFYEREPWIVAGVLEFIGTGEASGIQVSKPHAHTYRFRGELIEYQRVHVEREAAFAEGGIEPPPR